MGKLTFKGHFRESYCDSTGECTGGIRQVKMQNCRDLLFTSRKSYLMDGNESNAS